MPKTLFVAVVFAGVVAAALAQTQCLPQTKLLSDVKIKADPLDDICNATTPELNELAEAIIARVYVPGSTIPSGCRATLLGNATCKEKGRTKSTPGKTKSKSNGKDTLEIDVTITCTGIGSDPCATIAGNPNTSSKDFERMFRSLFKGRQFRRPNFPRSLVVDDMTMSLRIKNKKKPSSYCQVSSSNEGTKNSRRGRKRPRSCSKCCYSIINDTFINISLDCPASCPL